MRRELEGSRREIEALRKSSADGGAAQKELSTVRRELENTKKQADVARTDVEVCTPALYVFTTLFSEEKRFCTTIFWV